MAENIENNSGFGLPEMTMKPLTDAVAAKPPVQRSPRRPKKKSNAPLIILLFLGIVAVAGGIWWFMNKDKNKDVIAKTDSVEETTTGADNDDAGDGDISDASEDITYDADAVIDDGAGDTTDGTETNVGGDNTNSTSTTASSNRGHITNVSSRTGRAYIIAGSFIDADLANDYGKKLARKGVNTKIISPEGDNKFFRLSVADYGSIAAAAGNLDRLKTVYGDNLWVIKH